MVINYIYIKLNKNMRIHNIYNDLLQSITYLFDGNLLDSSAIKKYEFNIGNRSFQIEYDTKFVMPAAIINLVDSRPLFSVAPFAHNYLNIPNTSKLIALKNNTLNSELLLQTQYYEVGIDIIINCESQYQALEIQQRLLNKLPLAKPLEVYEFVSYLEIDSVFLASIMFDVYNHDIDNLYTQFNPTLGKDEYSFSITYTPRIKMDSCQVSIQTSTAHSWSVNCNFQFFLPWPILLEYVTRGSSIYGSGVGPSTMHVDVGAKYNLTTLGSVDDSHPIPIIPFISIDQSVQPSTTDITNIIGEDPNELIAKNLIIPCNSYQILYTDVTDDLLITTYRVGKPYNTDIYFSQADGFTITSSLADKKISVAGSIEYNFKTYDVDNIYITEYITGNITANIDNANVVGKMYKSILDENNNTITGRFVGIIIDIDDVKTTVDTEITINYTPSVSVQNIIVDNITSIPPRFSHTVPKLSNITDNAKLLINEFYANDLIINQEKTQILSFQITELLINNIIDIDISLSNILLDSDYRFSFGGSFINNNNDTIQYNAFGVLNPTTFKLMTTLDILTGDPDDYEITFFMLDLSFISPSKFSKRIIDDIIVSAVSEDTFISSNMNFNNDPNILLINSKLKFNTDDISSNNNITTIIFRYENITFLHDYWELTINSFTYNSNDSEIILINQTPTLVEFQLDDGLYNTFNISQINPLLLKFYRKL